MLKDLLVSEVRVRVLQVLLDNINEEFHVRALVRSVGTEINAVRRELQRLEKIGFVKKRPSGNKVYYRVDTASLYFPELLSLIGKETGLGYEIVRNEKHLGDVKFAMVAKEFLRGRKSTVMDVDALFVGNMNMDVLERVIKNYEAKSDIEVMYTVMSEDEFQNRKRRQDNFVLKILAQGRVMLVGDEQAFSDLL